jgi:hypothetical protein
MSTVTDTIFLASKLSTTPRTPNNREGDWNNYLHQIAASRDKTSASQDVAKLLAYKRQCALAYLGKRAQLCGGVCGKRPIVLTPEAIIALGESNRTKRYDRYPWIETLLKLMAEIELIQDQSAGAPKVFSLVQSIEESPSAHHLELADNSRSNAS